MGITELISFSMNKNKFKKGTITEIVGGDKKF